MSDFKDSWDLPMALDVLQSESIDAETWSEAVKWLMLYGPPELQDLLATASRHATGQHFPEIKPQGFNDQGDPLYDVVEIAKALGISLEEAAKKLNEMEFAHNVQYLFDMKRNKRLQ